MDPTIVNRLNDKNTPSPAFSDKLLGKDTSRILRQLIKGDLGREELLELLYLLTDNELKLSNLDPYDRYLLGKYFTWIRDLVKLGEFIYDFQEKLKEAKPDDKLDKIVTDIKNMVLHDIKFSVDIYLYLMRSTLGVSAFAFDSLSKSRFEYQYDHPESAVSLKAPNDNKLRILGGR